MAGDNNAQNSEIVTLYREPDPDTVEKNNASSNRQQSSIQTSTQTYRDVNRTLGSFYEKPREDPEKERMREELEELKKRISETETQGKTVDNQLELMERSFQMAARYMPEMTGGAGGTGGTLGTHGTLGTSKCP